MHVKDTSDSVTSPSVTRAFGARSLWNFRVFGALFAEVVAATAAAVTS